MASDTQQGAPKFNPADKILPMEKAIQNCQGRDLYKNVTQAVFGELESGDKIAEPKVAVMMIGEQSGDHKDKQRRPAHFPRYAATIPSGVRTHNLRSLRMADETIVEKAGFAVGMGLEAASEAVNALKTAIDSTVGAVTRALKKATIKKAVKKAASKAVAKKAVKKTSSRNIAKKSTVKKTAAKKAIKEAAAKKAPAKKTATKKTSTKKAVKKLVKKLAKKSGRKPQ